MFSVGSTVALAIRLNFLCRYFWSGDVLLLLPMTDDADAVDDVEVMFWPLCAVLFVDIGGGTTLLFESTVVSRGNG